ncbi:hypothetical protein G6F57_003598 [Rhizopus arrhizus]|nr:hypothetical protein G6F23_007680 [Rhizopus arrhizus]KAG1410992.1 hypothetical protein G6F58_008807 [Rhizopus delemar]KAG0934257.1 hypothetical protein G6F32_010789 [Rhizopus arrhizus]KAG0945499.1 hypothetical protein G6F30_004241 [Rhizopus arrhizus]KAG0980524.1 hypothetical protein G6F29_007761 [Rhizopus arrhizus]
MKWITQYLHSIYSSPCSQPSSVIPSPVTKVIEPLSPIVPIDCKGCSKPCTHPMVPEDLKIDQSRPLQNTVPPYAIHLIIMTGKTDWPAHIEDEGLVYALTEAIRKRKDKKRTLRYHPYKETSDNDRILITNASLPSIHSNQRKAVDILLLPDNIIFSNITQRRVDSLLDYIFGKPLTSPFSIHPCPFTNLVLICGHGSKDRRCGTVGPMIQKALQQAAKEQSDHQTEIVLVSHLGGHAFAGNLVIYTHQGQRAIWYGRVTPCYCQAIIDNSLQDDKVIEDLVRGIFEVQSSTKCHLEW